MFVRFTDAGGRVTQQQGATERQTRGLYRYAVEVATADYLIELVSGGEVIASHFATWSPPEHLREMLAA